MATQLSCIICSSVFPAKDHRWRCDCGGLLDILFQPCFPMDKIKERPPNMWRYREAIPIDDNSHIVSFGEGFTPMAAVDFNGLSVLVKQEHLFPTGSYKDRGAAVLVSLVRCLGIEKVVEDSSGNAGSSIAAYCAAAGIACDVYVPSSTSPGKLAQIQLYGANLYKIPGSREDTANTVMDAAKHYYYASHSWNPFFFHGTKTFAFEVAEQLGWESPDTLILPAGNGTLLLGAYLGFKELVLAGVVEKIPCIIAVQAQNCAPLHRAFKRDLKKIPSIEDRKTIAEGIAIAAPIRGEQILAAVKETGGDFITVSESEIRDSHREMCRKGFYIEPTSAAAVAGVKKYTAEPGHESERMVSVFTGHGLKAGNKMLEII